MSLNSQRKSIDGFEFASTFTLVLHSERVNKFTNQSSTVVDLENFESRRGRDVKWGGGY